ncbi:hypothetical protein Droror1_Dr00014885 [Drosera rotundifolia]
MNSLGGEIPHWLREIPYLRVLNLSYNHLGTALDNPDFISGMESFYALDIRSNMFRGEIPDFGNNMEYFDASNNQLSGEIPSSFCNMALLYLLDLSNNSLHAPSLPVPPPPPPPISSLSDSLSNVTSDPSSSSPFIVEPAASDHWL